MSVIAGQPYRGTANRPTEPGAKVWFLHVLLLVALAATVTVWGATLIAGTSSQELVSFISLVGFFGVGCAFFVVSRVRMGLQSVFEAPVLMTFLAFVMFGAAPIICFLDPDTLLPNLHGDTSLFNPALQIVIVGMVAFWLGAGIAQTRKTGQVVLDHPSSRGSGPQTLTLALGVVVYLAGFGAKVYMLRAGMYYFLGSQDVVQAHLAEQQVLIVISSLGLCALILFSIEACFHPQDKLRVGLFWTVLASECFWGIMSGFKAMVLYNFLAVAVVSSVARRKLKMRWFVITILGLVIIYPWLNRYRSIVGGRGGDATFTATGAAEAVRGAAGQSASQERSVAGWMGSGFTSSVGRFNMLQDVALLLAYQDRSYMLEGDERLWMIPFYPFVPRFLWPGKPIDSKGVRFAKMVGPRAQTSTAPTVPGDLYVLNHGIPGVLVGMFLIGLAVQWLTNPVTRCPSKRNLFIYACVFFAATEWQLDFFGYWTGLIRTFAVAQILALMLYGPARATARLGAKVQDRK